MFFINLIKWNLWNTLGTSKKGFGEKNQRLEVSNSRLKCFRQGTIVRIGKSNTSKFGWWKLERKAFKFKKKLLGKVRSIMWVDQNKYL